MTDSIATAFDECFGNGASTAVIAAAKEHENGVNSTNKGTDPFKWALLIAIGYECMSVDGYREYHGIDFAPWDEIKAWIVEHGDLASHDGDCDYLALACGSYNDFVADSAEHGA